MFVAKGAPPPTFYLFHKRTLAGGQRRASKEARDQCMIVLERYFVLQWSIERCTLAGWSRRPATCANGGKRPIYDCAGALLRKLLPCSARGTVGDDVHLSEVPTSHWTGSRLVLRTGQAKRRSFWCETQPANGGIFHEEVPGVQQRASREA